MSNVDGRAIYPGFGYDDAHGAIDFLVRAFGFERGPVYEAGGLVAHAQLSYGDATIMLGSIKPEEPYGRVSPKNVKRAAIASYLVTEDVEQAYARAIAAGARSIDEPHPVDYDPSLGCGVEDPEGYLWGLGGYRPQRSRSLCACVREIDADALIDALERDFDFERVMVVEGDTAGDVAHAEVAFGPDGLMIGSDRADHLNFGPIDGERVAGGIYIARPDVEPLYARVRDRDGITVTRPLETTDYGSTEFSVTLRGGRRLSFGTYAP